eukprot:6186004-Pleurochrysis_carterae.AAC.2
MQSRPKSPRTLHTLLRVSSAVAAMAIQRVLVTMRSLVPRSLPCRLLPERLDPLRRGPRPGGRRSSGGLGVRFDPA